MHQASLLDLFESSPQGVRKDEARPLEDPRDSHNVNGTWHDSGRPPKRIRLSSVEHDSEPITEAHRLRQKLGMLLSAQNTVDLHGLEKPALYGSLLRNPSFV